MHYHFDAFAEAVSSRFLDSSDGLTVDIGCNDGLFLSSLQSRGKRTLGIDPATNIVEVTRELGSRLRA
jgi:methylation protein EvaC